MTARDEIIKIENTRLHERNINPDIIAAQKEIQIAKIDKEKLELQLNSQKPSFTCAHEYEEVSSNEWEEGDPEYPINYKQIIRECTKCGDYYKQRL